MGKDCTWPDCGHDAPAGLNSVQTATGFLVTYAAGEQRQYELCDDLKHARDSYSLPPMGWTSLGINPTLNGVPISGPLDVPTIQFVRPYSKVTA